MEKKFEVSERNITEGKVLTQCYAICKIEFLD